MKCLRCLNQNPQLFFENKGKQICRVCLQFSAQQFESLQPLLIQPHNIMLTSIKLSKQQEVVSNKLVEAGFSNDILIDAVCGAGKTAICYAYLLQGLRQGYRIGWMVPRRQVVLQIYEELKQVFGQFKVVVVTKGYTDDLDGQLVVLTAHQLYRYHQQFDYLIIDEPDAFPYKNNLTLMHFAQAAVKKHCIYLSATADESLKKLQTFSLHQRYHQRPLVVPTCFIVFREWCYVILFYWLWKLRKQKVLVFVPTIEMANQLSKILSIPALTSQTQAANDLIQQFQNKNSAILLCTTVLERGVTFENIHVIVFFAHHQIFDTASLVQIAGRVDRCLKQFSGRCLFIGYKMSEEMRVCISKINHHNQCACGV